MFGYITINAPELKIRDYQTYHSFYCGMCRSLKKKYGRFGQLALNYDLTFLAMLQTGLYEQPEEVDRRFCALHPTRKMEVCSNLAVEYAADMTMLLAYFQYLDHWEDDGNAAYLAEAAVLRKKVRKLSGQYPRQFGAVVRYVKLLRLAQQKGESDLDVIAGLTGTMLGEIFVMQEDEWSDTLRKTGFFLGKFIYLMDAYEDLEKDEKKGSYNPLSFWKEKEPFDEWCRSILTYMMADCCREFERLPILLHVDILRNILYSGVWTKFDQITQKRAKEGIGG